ncbi:hypothetical protein OAB57_01975 [Bacteriovoracaceae bacterium]|nr:hypothetical protein [Bacteriovoracaceae bacterium]
MKTRIISLFLCSFTFTDLAQANCIAELDAIIQNRKPDVRKSQAASITCSATVGAFAGNAFFPGIGTVPGLIIGGAYGAGLGRAMQNKRDIEVLRKIRRRLKAAYWYKDKDFLSDKNSSEDQNYDSRQKQIKRYPKYLKKLLRQINTKVNNKTNSNDDPFVDMETDELSELLIKIDQDSYLCNEILLRRIKKYGYDLHIFRRLVANLENRLFLHERDYEGLVERSRYDQEQQVIANQFLETYLSLPYNREQAIYHAAQLRERRRIEEIQNSEAKAGEILLDKKMQSILKLHPKFSWPNEMEDEMCPICMDEMNSSKPTTRTHCGHNFHSTCIKDWIKINSKHNEIDCPNCRADLSKPLP